MNPFSKKSTFLLGSLIGSVLGLLFAREAGKNLREKLQAAKTPQKKFEALFQEYLKAGKSAVEEAKKSESLRELVKGGKEILAELQKKAEKEGGSAVKFAQKKAQEVLQEMERQVSDVKKGVKKEVTKKKTAAKKLVITKAKNQIKKVARKVAAKKTASAKKKTTRRVTKKK